MRALEIATHPSQAWQLGGILEELIWPDPDPIELLLWTGEKAVAHQGDTVVLLHRGLPASAVIEVRPA